MANAESEKSPERKSGRVTRGVAGVIPESVVRETEAYINLERRLNSYRVAAQTASGVLKGLVAERDSLREKRFYSFGKLRKAAIRIRRKSDRRNSHLYDRLLVVKDAVVASTETQNSYLQNALAASGIRINDLLDFSEAVMDGTSLRKSPAVFYDRGLRPLVATHAFYAMTNITNRRDLNSVKVPSLSCEIDRKTGKQKPQDVVLEVNDQSYELRVLSYPVSPDGNRQIGMFVTFEPQNPNLYQKMTHFFAGKPVVDVFGSLLSGKSDVAAPVE